MELFRHGFLPVGFVPCSLVCVGYCDLACDCRESDSRGGLPIILRQSFDAFHTRLAKTSMGHRSDGRVGQSTRRSCFDESGNIEAEVGGLFFQCVEAFLRDLRCSCQQPEKPAVRRADDGFLITFIDVKNPVVAFLGCRDQRAEPGIEAHREFGVFGRVEHSGAALDVVLRAIRADGDVAHRERAVRVFAIWFQLS